MNYYKLDSDHNPIPCSSKEWAALYEEEAASRRVAETFIIRETRVSTVFLGLDHRFGDRVGLPILFETMVFGGDGNAKEDCERYSTWREAEEGHQRMVEKWRGKHDRPS